ncbi:hypothetical protein AB0F11_26950 [Streptomyces sp. NPDC032472]|uniref:hypothetical protein n=1 Tax=Streptomyces sp. NPDC032472 TaxID=3155018 RepID=UPI0033D451CE
MTFSVSALRRRFGTLAMTAAAAVALGGATVVTAVGPAVASSGGGCTGPSTRQACVAVVAGDEGRPTIRFDARADLAADAGPACRLRLVSFDDTTGWRWDGALVPCGKSQQLKFVLSNPTAGHVYRAELQFLPNGKNHEFAEFVKGPSLAY